MLSSSKQTRWRLDWLYLLVGRLSVSMVTVPIEGHLLRLSVHRIPKPQRLNQIYLNRCVIAVALLAHKSIRCNTTNHDGPPPIPTSIMPCLAFILSPNSPFYHHCFPSLRCRRKRICAERQTTSRTVHLRKI